MRPLAKRGGAVWTEGEKNSFPCRVAWQAATKPWIVEGCGLQHVSDVTGLTLQQQQQQQRRRQ